MKKKTILLCLATSTALLLCGSCTLSQTEPPATGHALTTTTTSADGRRNAFEPSRTQTASPAMQFIAVQKYSFGVLRALANADIFTLDRAVRSTCSRARLVELQRITRSNEVLYTYRDIQNVRLTITIHELQNNQTRIAVKVDKFGNRINSEELIQAIDDDLKAINHPMQ